MGERRESERRYHNNQAGDSLDWLDEPAPLHMHQMDIGDANLFGLDRFLEGEGPSEQAEQPPALRLRGAESRGLPIRMTGGGQEGEREGRAPSPSGVQAGPSGTDAGTNTDTRPAGGSSSALDPALGSSAETQQQATGGSHSDSRGSVQTERRAEGGQQAGGKRRGKRKLPVPDLDAIEDPLERRKQRRLLKNRNTAAASRERKQRDLDALTSRMHTLERDNAALKSMLANRDGEIQALSAQVVSLSERLGEDAPMTGGGGEGASGGGNGGEVAAREGPGDPSNGRSGVGDPVLGLHPGQPLPVPDLERMGEAGRPGLVVGVDGQWLRLRPGFELPSPGGSADPQQQQQQSQQQGREADWRAVEAQQRQRQHQEDEDGEDSDAEPADDGGRDSDPQWLPGRKGRKKGRRSR